VCGIRIPESSGGRGHTSFSVRAPLDPRVAADSAPKPLPFARVRRYDSTDDPRYSQIVALKPVAKATDAAVLLWKELVNRLLCRLAALYCDRIRIVPVRRLSPRHKQGYSWDDERRIVAIWRRALRPDLPVLVAGGDAVSEASFPSKSEIAAAIGVPATQVEVVGTRFDRDRGGRVEYEAP
jgi:hypothetical protein